MSKVIPFPGLPAADVDPDDVLQEAKGELSEVVVFGFDLAGEEYLRSSGTTRANALWLLERLKFLILQGDTDE